MNTNGTAGPWWQRRESLQSSHEQQLPGLRRILEALVVDLDTRFEEHGIRAVVRGRVKTFDAFYRKLLERSRAVEIAAPFSYITDSLGLRVVAPFFEDLQRAEEIIREAHAVEEVDDKALALSVGEFGYDATHLLIGIPEVLCRQEPSVVARVAEVQIRTTLQDAWAEVEHELVYKADLDVVDLKIRRKLLALNATLSLADTIFQELRDYQRRRYTELRDRHARLMDKVSTIPEKMGSGRRIKAPPQPERTADRSAPRAANTADEQTSDLLVRALQAHLDADLTEAIALYSEVLALNPTLAVLNHRGIAYFALSEYEKAIADFSRAIARAPQEARAYTNRGLAYRMAGRLKEAQADLDHSLELNPMWADTLYGRALTHFDLGNIPEALRDCDRAIAINPSFKQVLRFKQFIQDADL